MKNFIAIIVIGFLLQGCKQQTEETGTKKKSEPKVFINEKDSVATVERNTPKIKIDSVKMHAFDNIFFGYQNEPISAKYIINDMEYFVQCSQSVPSKGLSYFSLENKSKITTEKRAKAVLNELKSTISKRYPNGKFLNKSLLIQHPEDREKK